LRKKNGGALLRAFENKQPKKVTLSAAISEKGMRIIVE